MKFKPLMPFGVEVQNYTGSVEQIHQIREQVVESSLVLIRDVPTPSDEGLLELAENLSFKTGSLQNKVLHWDFGPIMRMHLDPNAKNYLFSDEEVPFHWDGAFHVEPQFLLFVCTQSEGSGGETLFSQTENIWNSLEGDKKESLRNLHLNFETEKKAHYGGRINVPLVQTHPIKGSPILRFAEEVKTHLNPVHRSVDKDQHIGESPQKPLEDSLKELTEMVYNPQFCFQHQWKTHDILIADNFSLVHGRRALGRNRLRSFKRIQVL